MNLICMSFDGDYVTELKDATLEQCQEHSANLGSKWFFYPFRMITTDSGKTIKEAGGTFVNMQTKKLLLDGKLKGRRTKAVCRLFKHLSGLPEMQNVDAEQFEYNLIEYLLK